MAKRRVEIARHDVLLISLLLLISAGIFWLDILTPLGVAAGVPYVAVVFLGAWVRWRHGIILLTVIGTILTLLGYLFSEPGGIAWMVVANRGLALFAIWVTAFLLIQRRGAEEELKAAHDELEARVVERTAELAKANTDLQGQIAERKQVESGHRFQASIIETMMEGVVLVQLDNAEIVYANPNYELMFGYGPGEINGKHGSILNAGTDDEKKETARVIMAELNETGEWRGEVHNVRKDGTTFWCYATVKIMDHPEYGPVGVSIHTDIAERKRVENTLQENEERFRDFAVGASDWFWEMDVDFRFTYHSERYFEITGFRPEDKLGTTRTQYVSGTDMELNTENWTAHLADLKAHMPFKNFEYSFTSVEGHLLHVRINGTPVFDPEGRFLGYRGTGTDITEHRQAEEEAQRSEARLLDALDAMSEGFALYDADECLVLFNERYLEVLPNLQDVLKVGAKFEDIVRAGAERGLVPTAIGRVDEYVRERMERFRNPTGPIEYNQTRGHWIRTEERETAEGGIVAIRTDITDRRRAEEQLRQAQKMEAVGQLTGGVAHDFNNLLAVILGNAEIAEDRRGEKDDSIEAIIRAAERGAELTQRLLAFSRRQPFDSKPIDLGALVGDMHQLLYRTLGETIDIEIATAPSLWNTVADPSQLENALLNLALNARDAMPDGGKLIIEAANVSLSTNDVTSHIEAAPGDYVSLSVSDTGNGMSPEVMEHALEPFFTTRDVGEGSGLGLSMVYGFAKQSGGDITIESNLGHGTTVKLFLPRAKGAVEQPKQSAALSVPKARGETVLVVEDEPDVRAMAETMLEKLGYRVFSAENARAGLDILKTESAIDLLLSDVVLPGSMSGPDMTEHAKAIAPGIKVLFMSGHAESSIHLRTPLPEGSDLLDKPFRTNELAHRVRAVLDQ